MHEGHRQRMRERFRISGPDGFSSHELLEMLLFYAYPRQDVNPVAHRLLEEFGSLSAVFGADRQALCGVDGMTPHAADFLGAIGAATHRARVEETAVTRVRNTRQLCEYACALFQGETVEKMMCLCLDASGRILAQKFVAEGTQSSVSFHPRQVASFAIRHDAHAVILAHNHPAGNLNPTGEDVALTQTMKSALEGVGIALIEHLIVGTDRAYGILSERLLDPAPRRHSDKEE